MGTKDRRQIGTQRAGRYARGPLNGETGRRIGQAGLQKIPYRTLPAADEATQGGLSAAALGRTLGATAGQHQRAATACGCKGGRDGSGCHANPFNQFTGRGQPWHRYMLSNLLAAMRPLSQ